MDVLGVDAMAKGWIGVRLSDHAPVSVFAAPTIGELEQTAGEVDLIAIDIPIGLPLAGRRAADAEARKQVGIRGSSVFSTAIREALLAETFQEGNRIATLITGQGLSQQAYALRTKILEVEEWIATYAFEVREVHPEVSFRYLAEKPLGASKRSWSGFNKRRNLLRSAGIELPDKLGEAGTLASVDELEQQRA